MTLDEVLLQKLAEWRPDSGRQTLNVPDEGTGWATAVTADRSDVLGCQLWEMSLRRITASEARNPDSLHDWAQGAAKRVTGLLEPLAVVEVDTLRDEALLRSLQPARRADQLYYYEVNLKGVGQASVRRYQGSHLAGRREQVPFVLTHEALAKLASDLTASV